LSVVLPLYLLRRGLSAPLIGAVLTATLVEDALFTALISAFAERLGRRRVLVVVPLFLTLAGVLLAVATQPWLLIVAAVLGTLSPSGQEAGPFSPLEQAALPESVPAAARTRAFAWYNLFGFLPSALGALAVGAWMAAARQFGLGDLEAYRWLLGVYAALGVALSLLYSRLSSPTEDRGRQTEDGQVSDVRRPPSVVLRPPSSVPQRRFGLHRSRGIVFQLAGLQAVDAFAGGFIVQSLLVYWFHRRFGIGPEVLGPLFFGTNLLSAASFLIAARVAERFGLLNTMVFTHLPSNVLLALVPLMPSLPLAGGLLLARHLLSQMDVPTRQAYTMALVAPDERAAAAGFTTSARAAAQAVAPLFTGFALARAATGLPFFLAGGLKVLYDLALYWRFRRVVLPDE
jgi:MFS family permease